MHQTIQNPIVEVSRIAEAIEKAGLAQEEAVKVAVDIAGWCHAEYDSPYSIGDIQATVIRELGKQGYEEVQSKYLKYSEERNIVRYKGSKILDVYSELLSSEHEDRRENANINPDGAMGIMLKVGSELSKEANLHSMPKHLAKFHTSGRGHWHDLDFLDKTTTCCQIDLLDLCKKIRQQTDLDIWVYTGFEEDEIHLQYPEILSCVDALVLGKFIQEEKTSSLPFIGSKNQKIIYF